jgi:hypothetical protein
MQDASFPLRRAPFAPAQVRYRGFSFLANSLSAFKGGQAVVPIGVSAGALEQIGAGMAPGCAQRFGCDDIGGRNTPLSWRLCCAMPWAIVAPIERESQTERARPFRARQGLSPMTIGQQVRPVRPANALQSAASAISSGQI